MKLEDLFVKPETRGMGVGKAFFAELARVAEEKVSPRSYCLGEFDRSVRVAFSPGLCPDRLVCAQGTLWSDPSCLVPTHGCYQWNTPSIDFYEKSLGASAMSEWMGMRLEGGGIQNLKQFAL